MNRFLRPTGRATITADDTPDTSVTQRRHHGGRRAALALAVLAMLASTVLTLGPADPASAQISNPVLIVGGHGNTNAVLEDWADYLGDEERLDLPDDKVRGLQLRIDPDAPFGGWPGTESNEISAYSPGGLNDDVYDAIIDLSNDYGGAKVEVMAVSQGALVVRWLLQQNPGNIRSRVASYISFSGVNAGIPDFLAPLDWCESVLEDDFPVCEEMVWEPSAGEDPGETAWLINEVNKAPSGDPTPNGQGDASPTIAYYHIYTWDDEGETDLPDYMGQEFEAAEPYGWGDPLKGATNRAAQEECGVTYTAPHGGWTGTTPDLVMHELLMDAFHRRPLDAPATLC